jgi:acyl dehydratase
VTIAALERTITLTDMVAYAGATWDWHRLHYDPAFVATKGLERPVVDGQVLGALMAEQLMDELGPHAWITNLGLRYRAMMFAGDTVRIEASVTDDDGVVTSFTQRALVGERIVAEGTAKVRRG